MKIAIIGVGVAVATVGVVWAWRDGGALKREVQKVAHEVVKDAKKEFRRDLAYAKREVGEAHKRADAIETLVKDEVKKDVDGLRGHINAHTSLFSKEIDEIKASLRNHSHAGGKE